MKKRYQDTEFRIYMKQYNEKMRSQKEIRKRSEQIKKRNRKSEKEKHLVSEKWGLDFNQKIDNYNVLGNINFFEKKATIHLPKEMNFSNSFEETSRTILIIREFVDNHVATKSNKYAYKLSSIDFDRLEKISTSAGLVLAATISEWQEKMERGRMKASHESWNDSIKTQLVQLGFFELFGMVPPNITDSQSTIKSIKYIRGTSASDDKKIFELKAGLENILGVDLKKQKWPYLVSGITEAMTNALQHAYPRKGKTNKPWFMSGGYDVATRRLKIVFYDLGIGIPKSLPKTQGKEKMRELVARVSEGYGDAHLIQAAVKLGRTSTAKEGRGKGLSDMLDFINQRKSGYLSIMSLRGLYKYEKPNRNSDKIESLTHPILGTLIIWSVEFER